MKVDNLFKLIFGNPENIDIAKSLIKAVLPDEEKIDDLKFLSKEIFSDKYFYDANSDVLGRSELAVSRVFNNLYHKRDIVHLKEKIYCINFLYFNQFPDDKDYYHHLFTHEFNKKEISLPFKDIILIELKKFKENFDLKKMKKKLLCDKEKNDREFERQLWFVFLSHINTMYYMPKIIDESKYLKIEKNNKTVIYVKNELNEDLYKELINVGPIRKALDICTALSKSDEDEYVNIVQKEMQSLKEIEEKQKEIEKQKKELKKKDEVIENTKKELKNKDEVIKNKDEIIENTKKEMEILRKRIQELEGKNEGSNDDQNYKKMKFN